MKTYSNGVKLLKNNGNGKKYAFVLPSGMTGKKFDTWKKKNENEITSDIESIMDEEKDESDINMPVGDRYFARKNEVTN